jgi:putative ABC transport system substrate-binding protein
LEREPTANAHHLAQKAVVGLVPDALLRRTILLVLLVLGLLAVPLAAEAQPAGRVPRIGILPGGPLAPRVHQWDAFRQTLRELGYTEGQNIIFEFRPPAREGDPFENLAADLVRLNVDVIVATAERAIRAARQATSTIPIVMCPSRDPVREGFVTSLARPGGNITGLSILTVELTGKRLEILREIVPKASRVAVLWTPGGAESPFRAAELAARAMGVELVSLEAAREEDLEKAFEAAAKRRAGALLVLGSPAFFGLRARITDLAQKHRLPGMYWLPSFAHAGGLVVYGPSDTEYYRRAAIYVDRILKGAKPADLPVEQPTKFELIINLKTARALGLTIPLALLLRADQVIE